MTNSGSLDTEYVPEPTDKSTRIMFIQVMRERLDGVPLKPSVADRHSAFQDSYTTGDMFHVDANKGDKSPYYNAKLAYGRSGRAVGKRPRPAWATDSPDYGDNSFPDGKSTLAWEFRTAAFSAAGEDSGTYYAYGDWIYTKVKSQPALTEIVGTSNGDPGAAFKSAVGLFCSARGFALPSAGDKSGADE